MNINVYAEYKIRLKNEYSYINDREYNEYTYKKEKEEWEDIKDGSWLMETIARLLNDIETITIIEENNTIYIEKFDPTDGTGAKIEIFYEETQQK